MERCVFVAGGTIYTRPQGVCPHFHMPSLAYCATLNNWEQEDWDVLSTPNSKLQYIIVGQEVGTEGTRHLQIYFQLAKQTKLTTIKNWGGPWARMHMEGARGTDEEASVYCKKDGNFIEIGERLSMGRKGARNDLSELQKDIEKGLSYDELCETHFEAAAKYHKFIRERVQARDTCKELGSLRKEFESASLRPWQQVLVEIVKEDPNPRAIHWIWEDKGNVGKSWMTKYLAAMYKACVLTADRKSDMAYLYSKNPSKVVVFDLSRTAAPKEDQKWDRVDAAYSLAEDLKNGMVVSTKYDSTNILTRGCHVIFFANFEPDMTKWSRDRYFITKL